MDAVVSQTPLEEIDDRDILAIIQAEEHEPEDIDCNAQNAKKTEVYSTDEKIKSLTVCIDIFEDDPVANFEIIKALRRRLVDLKWDAGQRMQESLKQPSIESYFGRKSNT